jgi:hypothetical protein
VTTATAYLRCRPDGVSLAGLARDSRSLPYRGNPKELAQLARAGARRKITELEAAQDGAEFITPAHAALLAARHKLSQVPGHAAWPSSRGAAGASRGSRLVLKLAPVPADRSGPSSA